MVLRRPRAGNNGVITNALNVGLSDGRWIEVESGLQEGDRVLKQDFRLLCNRRHPQAKTVHAIQPPSERGGGRLAGRAGRVGGWARWSGGPEWTVMICCAASANGI